MDSGDTANEAENEESEAAAHADKAADLRAAQARQEAAEEEKSAADADAETAANE